MLAAPEPLLLVGGQAVNLWALYYGDRTNELAPFVSRDADILGDRGTLELLGKIAGAKPQFFPLKPPSNEIGVVIGTDAHGATLLVEVLRYVNGVDERELRQPAYEFAIGQDQVRVRAPGPIALFKAKVANLADIKQAGREDGRHVIILARLMPAYVADLARSAIDGKLGERALLDMLAQLLAIVVSKPGRRACKDLELDPPAFFREIDAGRLPKLASFLKERVPRALKVQ